MNAEMFVDTLRIVVERSAVDATLTNLDRPPGRKPSDKLIRSSEFFHSLTDEQQANVRAIVEDAVHGAVFGFLCVIDGVRAIEDGPSKGRIELRYVGRDGVRSLNAPDGPLLHELYNSTAP